MKKNSRSRIAFLGIGSNQDDPLSQCLRAVKEIAALENVRLLRTSSWYHTDPVGFERQERFVNAVAEVRTVRGPHDLLKALQGIESAMGRVREIKWGPRIIDLDILLFGQEIIGDDHLVIPHPELHRRRFVLVPLNEIASYAIHPLFGITMKGLLDRLEDRSEVEPLKDPRLLRSDVESMK